MLAVLSWMLSVKMCSIYIVEILGQFHVNADFFAARKNPILLLCYIKYRQATAKDKFLSLILKVSRLKF